MTDVFVKNIEVPRIPRNKRIYGGYSFNTTNKYEESQAGSGTAIHRELGILTELESTLVEVVFGEDFTKTPVGIDNLKVYRVAQMGGGYGSKDVLFTYPTAEFVSLTGFILNIHSSESLTGVIIEYNFTE